MIELLREAVSESLHEVIVEPQAFLIEFVQAALLIGVVFYFGSKFVRRYFAKRRDRIADELNGAEAAEKEHEAAQRDAQRIVAQAQKDAEELLEAGRAAAEAERVNAVAAIERDAGQLVSQAAAAIEAERTALTSRMCDQMVELVIVISKRYLGTAFTESEERALMQKAVLASLDRLDSLSA